MRKPFFLTTLLCSSLANAADPYLSPAEAVKKMEVPAGFSVDLIAAEPDLTQPIAFTFDAKGRIWVVEGHTYPTRAGSAKEGYGEAMSKETTGVPSPAQLADIMGGADRIVIFSDTDHNGSFETKKVFLEGLNLVSGIEVGHGGVYVGAAPYLLHVKDADGDDKPDGAPEIMLDGFGWQDTHETLNTFLWGPDGWLYGCHGVFTHARVGRPGTAWDKLAAADEPAGYAWTTARGQRVPLNCGYWRFHPTQKVFEVVAHGTSNPWGLDYNENGDWFSEACVIDHFWHVVPGGYYLRQSNPLGHFNPHVYTNIETIADHKHYGTDSPHAGNGKSDAFGGGHAHCGLCIYDGENFPAEYRGRPLFFNVHGHRINQEVLVQNQSSYIAKHQPDFLKTNDKNFSGVALKMGPDGAVYFIDWYDRQKCHRTLKEEWDRTNGRLYRVKYDSTWKPANADLSTQAPQNLVSTALTQRGWPARTARQLLWEKQLAKQLLPLPTTFPQPNSPVAAAFLDACLLAKSPAKPNPHGNARERRHAASALQHTPSNERWEEAGKLTSIPCDTDPMLPQLIWYAVEPLVALDPARAMELAETSKITLVSRNITQRVASLGQGALEHLLFSLAKEKTAQGAIYLMQSALTNATQHPPEKMPVKWASATENLQDMIKRRPDALAVQLQLKDLQEQLAVAFGDTSVFPALRERLTNANLPLESRQQALLILAKAKDASLPPLVETLLKDSKLRPTVLQQLPNILESAK